VSFGQFLELSQHQQAFIHALRQPQASQLAEVRQSVIQSVWHSVSQSVSQLAGHSAIQSAKNLP